MHKFIMTETKAEAIHALIASHNIALKNWIASAVERGELERAQELVAELRSHELLFAAFNMQAKRDIAKNLNRAIETNHHVG